MRRDPRGAGAAAGGAMTDHKRSIYDDSLLVVLALVANASLCSAMLALWKIAYYLERLAAR